MRVPHNKDYSIFGSILGSPYFGKLPYTQKRNSFNCDTPLVWCVSPTHVQLIQV